MKPQFRVLGIDDGPFAFSDNTVTVAGVVWRANYIDAILKSELTVDGDDATDVLSSMARDYGPARSLAAIILDGATFGGFNVVDIAALNKDTGIPVITVTRDRPDFEKIAGALQKMGTAPARGRKIVTDWKERLERLRRMSLVEVATACKSVHIACTGLPLEDAKGIVRATTVRGAIPEPVRLAHLIATAVVRGKSYGNA